MPSHNLLESSSLQELLLFVLRRRQRVKVVGNSMLPMLKPDDEVLVDAEAYSSKRPQTGDLVVAWHPHEQGLKIIKRVHGVGPDGACYLLGDNPSESTDSRQYGVVSAEKIIGRVTSRFGS